MLSFAEQTKEPTVENEFCEEEGPREPRFPSMGFRCRLAKLKFASASLRTTVSVFAVVVASPSARLSTTVSVSAAVVVASPSATMSIGGTSSFSGCCMWHTISLYGTTLQRHGFTK